MSSNTHGETNTAPAPGGTAAPGPAFADTDTINILLKALADPQRYTILRVLASNACTSGVTNCTALLDSVNVSQPTLSHHMKELRSAGLVTEKREGRGVSYHLNRELFEAFLLHMRNELLPPFA